MQFRDLLKPHWRPTWSEIWAAIRWRRWLIVVGAGSASAVAVFAAALHSLIVWMFGESGWSAVRDVFVLFGALIGFWLVWLRSKAAADQALTGIAQHRTTLLNSAMQGLGANNNAQRLAAVQILADLVRSDIDTYFNIVIGTLAAVVRDNPPAEKEGTLPPFISSAEASVQAIADLRQELSARIDFSDRVALNYVLDFSGACVPGMRVVGGDLSGTRWQRANLRGAEFRAVNLEAADFSLANLTHAELYFARPGPEVLTRIDFGGAALDFLRYKWEGKATDEELEAVRDQLTMGSWNKGQAPWGVIKDLPAESEGIPF